MTAKLNLDLEHILAEEGLIDRRKLEDFVFLQKRDGRKLIDVLVEHNSVPDEKLAEALARKLNLPIGRWDEGKLIPLADQNLDELISYDFAQTNLVLPLARTLDTVIIAMVDPTDFFLVDNLEKMVSSKIKVVVASRGELLIAIKEFYPNKKAR